MTLNDPLNNRIRLLLFASLLSLPFYILFSGYSQGKGFIDLIHFGQLQAEKQLDAVKRLDPDEYSIHGYDGQYYAQLAVDPALLDDDVIIASDGAYRARRVGLSLLSYIIGHVASRVIGSDRGHDMSATNAQLVLQVYALINFAFWFLLLWILYRTIGLSTLKQFLLAFAILWTSGTLASLSRALLDLPSAVLVLIAGILATKTYIGATIFSYAVVIKETALLSILSLFRPENRELNIRQIIIILGIVTLPLILWVLYVRYQTLSWGSSANNSFGYPFLTLYQKYLISFSNMNADFESAKLGTRLRLLWEILGPMSLTIQSLYLILKPRFDSAYWRMGIGYVVLFCIITMPLWVEQYAYARILLLLTICFNLLVYYHEQGKRFFIWYVTGNIGLAWVAIRSLG